MIEQKFLEFFKIEKNQTLLNNNDFSELYENFKKQFGSINVRELTSILYECNINVLDLTDSIPDYFLFGALVIEKYPSLLNENFYIREGITNIGRSAFKYCRNIKRFYLPSTLEKIEEGGLYGFNAKEIYYNGTRADWFQKMDREVNWVDTNKIERLIFTDGEETANFG